MLRNIRLLISYDGTNYCGWQRQNDMITIQDTIEKAIFKVTKEEVILTGSGRTDANVHALGQVANFITNSNIEADRFAYAINYNLDNDIRILNSDEVSMDFNSRFSSKKKTYLYQIYNSRIISPFYIKYAMQVPLNLDLELMKNASQLLIGEHDFRAFMASNSEIKTTIRTIYDISIEKEENLIKIRITGNGFLYNMVRIIVGTLIDIGLKRKNEECIKKAINIGDRTLLGATARPNGLFLEKVVY